MTSPTEGYTKTTEAGIYGHNTEANQYLLRAAVSCPYTRRQLQKWLTFTGTLSEAKARREELKDELREQNRPVGEKRPTTVADYAEEWLMQRSNGHTPGGYSTEVNSLSHVLAVNDFGSLRLAEVDRQAVVAWVTAAEGTLMENGELYAQDTIRRWWRTLKALLMDARADDGLSRRYTLGDPPHARVKPPKSQRKNVRERKTLSFGELGALVEVARGNVPDRYAEIATLAFTGMRPGEMYALVIGDLDYRRGFFDVQRTLSEGEMQEVTKTEDPRQVPMPSIVAEAIQQHRQMLIKAQHVGLSTDLVFPSNAGTPRRNASIYKPLALCAEAVGIDFKVTPQVLRRTFNTLLLEQGTDRIVQRAMMGHVDEGMTQRYAGVRIETKMEAVKRLTERAYSDSNE